jgi:hypothetical protein
MISIAIRKISAVLIVDPKGGGQGAHRRDCRGVVSIERAGGSGKVAAMASRGRFGGNAMIALS